MTEHERPLGHLFVGLLIGGALGALVGILFAPKSGKQLRAEIRDKRNAVLEDAKNTYADTREKAKQIVEEAGHQAIALKKDANRHISEARQKTKEILAHANK